MADSAWPQMGSYLQDPQIQAMLLGQPPQGPMGPPAPQGATSPVAPAPTLTQPQIYAMANAMPKTPPSPATPPPVDNAPGGDFDAPSIEALRQQGLTVDQIKQRVAELQNKPLPLDFSPLAGLVDSWTGSNLAKNSAPEETAASRQATIDKLQDAVLKGQQGMSADQANILKSKLTAQWHADDVTARDQQHEDTAAATAAYRQQILAQKGDPAGVKADANTDKEYTNLGHELVGGTATNRTDFGKNQATITNAQKITALGAQGDVQKNGLTSQQMEDVAVATANLVSGGNGAAQAVVAAMVPKTAQGDASKIQSWLSGNPTGAQQQSFVKQMMDTADREKFVAQENIKGIKNDIFQGHVNLDPDDPRFKKLWNKHMGTDAALDSNLNYVRKPYAPGGMASTPPGMITVSDGKGDTRHISPSDEAAANADGYKRVP